jgi:hypothetical protein
VSPSGRPNPSKFGKGWIAALLRARRSGLGYGRAGNDDDLGRGWTGDGNPDHFGRGRAGDRNHSRRGRFRRWIGGLLLAPGSREQRAGQGSDHDSFAHFSPLKVGTGWAAKGNALGGDLFPWGGGVMAIRGHARSS